MPPVANGRAPKRSDSQPEHRLDDLRLDNAEDREHHDPAADQTEHQRAHPALGVVSVRLDAVGDADQHRDQPGGEGQVAPPVELGRVALAELTQLQVGPDRAEHAERH